MLAGHSHSFTIVLSIAGLRVRYKIFLYLLHWESTGCRETWKLVGAVCGNGMWTRYNVVGSEVCRHSQESTRQEGEAVEEVCLTGFQINI